MLSRRQFIALSAASAATALSGCTRTAAASIKIGYLPISESLPIFMAQKAGHFARENLAVELVPLDGGAKIVAAMTSGSLDFGVSNYVSQILARDSGLDIKLVAGGTVESRSNPQHALMVAPKSTLLPAQLAGKKIAVNTRKNVNELFMRAFLRQSGVDPESVSYVEVPFPRMLAALESGAVDAAGVIEPFVTFGARANLAKVIARFVVDVEDQIPISGWVASGKLVAERKDTALRFRSAIQRALADLTANPDQGKALLPTFTSMKEADARIVPLPTFVGETPPAGLPRLIERVRGAGWLTRPPGPVNDYVLAS